MILVLHGCYIVRALRRATTTKKRAKLKERQAEIGLRIEPHQQGNGDYRTTLEA
jgi:hypothetical protein